MTVICQYHTKSYQKKKKKKALVGLSILHIAMQSKNSALLCVGQRLFSLNVNFAIIKTIAAECPEPTFSLPPLSR